MIKNQNFKFQKYATAASANKVSGNVIDFTEKKILCMIKESHCIKITEFLNVLKYYYKDVIAIGWIEGKLVFINLIDYNNELL